MSQQRSISRVVKVTVASEKAIAQALANFIYVTYFGIGSSGPIA